MFQQIKFSRVYNHSLSLIVKISLTSSQPGIPTMLLSWQKRHGGTAVVQRRAWGKRVMQRRHKSVTRGNLPANSSDFYMATQQYTAKRDTSR